MCLRRSQLEPPDLSVVVPVGPGETAWKTLLCDLRWLSPHSEVLFSACEPAPAELADAARAAGAPAACQWLRGPPGRARQLNAGGERATRPWLWFLHADSRLGAAAARALPRALRAAPRALHYFRLEFLNDGPALTKLNAAGAWFRSTVLGLPFGDQGFCLARATWRRLGGFAEHAAYGEDHLFVWRARRRGVPTRCAGAAIYTSARKYQRHGWARVTATHLALTARQAASECGRLWRARLLGPSPDDEA